MKYIIKIKTTADPCYLTDSTGDPPRSFVKRNAKQFDSAEDAKKAIKRIMSAHSLRARIYSVEKLEF